MQNERVRVTVRVRNMGRGMKEKGKQVARRVHQKGATKKEVDWEEVEKTDGA